MMMGKICGPLIGLFVFLAGVVLYMFGTGGMEGTIAHQYAGILFVLAGLGFFVHGLEACPMCKAR